MFFDKLDAAPEIARNLGVVRRAASDNLPWTLRSCFFFGGSDEHAKDFDQLLLMEKRLRWQDLPLDTRQRVATIFALWFVERLNGPIRPNTSHTQEQAHESR